MPVFLEKALLFVLNVLGAAAGIITLGVLALMVGAVGGFVGHLFAVGHHFPAPLWYGTVAVCALLAPVWLGVWLWQNAIRPDDDPPRSS